MHIKVQPVVEITKIKRQSELSKHRTISTLTAYFSPKQILAERVRIRTFHFVTCTRLSNAIAKELEKYT